MKHTKEYADTIAATKYLYSKTEDSDLFIKAQEWCIDAYAKGYMKAIEETNVAGLLDALKEFVKKIEEIVEEESMELMDDDKAVIQRAINEIKKAE